MSEEGEGGGARKAREGWRLTLHFPDPESCREILKSIEHPFHNVV